MPYILGRMEKKGNARTIATTVKLHTRKDDSWTSVQGKSNEKPITTSVKTSPLGKGKIA